MWIELKIAISYPKALKMLTSIVCEYLARRTIAPFAPRPMLDHQQKFLQISAALMLLCSSLVHHLPLGKKMFSAGGHFCFFFFLFSVCKIPCFADKPE